MKFRFLLVILFLFVLVSCAHNTSPDVEPISPVSNDVIQEDLDTSVKPTVTPFVSEKPNRVIEEEMEPSPTATFVISCDLLGFDTEIAPHFVESGAAREELRSAVFGSRGWTIHFADENYVYAGYGEYSPLIVRYNINENTIDRALDVSGMAEYFPYMLAHMDFTADGLRMVYRNDDTHQTAHGIKNPPELPPTAYYIYEVDFETNRVTLLSETHEGWVTPDEFGNRLILHSGYGFRYTEMGETFYEGDVKWRATTLDGFNIDAYSPIDLNSGLFAALLCPWEEDLLALGYFAFAIVDAKEDRLITYCPINER